MRARAESGNKWERKRPNGRKRKRASLQNEKCQPKGRMQKRNGIPSKHIAFVSACSTSERLPVLPYLRTVWPAPKFPWHQRSFYKNTSPYCRNPKPNGNAKISTVLSTLKSNTNSYTWLDRFLKSETRCTQIRSSELYHSFWRNNSNGSCSKINCLARSNRMLRYNRRETEKINK